jgi:hypothetical protein
MLQKDAALVADQPGTLTIVRRAIATYTGVLTVVATLLATLCLWYKIEPVLVFVVYAGLMTLKSFLVQHTVNQRGRFINNCAQLFSTMRIKHVLPLFVRTEWKPGNYTRVEESVLLLQGIGKRVGIDIDSYVTMLSTKQH